MAERKIDFFDMEEPAQGVFELARKMLADISSEGVTAFDQERMRQDTLAMIKAGHEAKQKLYDPDIPKDKYEEADLAGMTYDGMRYKTAEALLAKATDMMHMRRKLNDNKPEKDNETDDHKTLIGLELDQLYVRIFEGWKPSAVGKGLVEKIFSGRTKGPETFGFLMQMYDVANHGGPGAVGAQELAREIDVKNLVKRGELPQDDQKFTKVIIPAAILNMVRDNEAQRGRG